MQQTSMQKEIINNDKIKGGFNMFKTLKKRIKNEKGLTLIELLAVIVILAIISAIAIPAISNIIAKQEEKAILADAQTYISAAKLAHADGACNKGTTDDTANRCTGTELSNYLDDSTRFSGTTNYVETDGSGNWTIVWKSPVHTFTKISGGNAIKSDTGLSEDDLQDLLK